MAIDSGISNGTNSAVPSGDGGASRVFDRYAPPLPPAPPPSPAVSNSGSGDGAFVFFAWTNIQEVCVQQDTDKQQVDIGNAQRSTLLTTVGAKLLTDPHKYFWACAICVAPFLPYLPDLLIGFQAYLTFVTANWFTDSVLVTAVVSLLFVTLLVTSILLLSTAKSKATSLPARLGLSAIGMVPTIGAPILIYSRLRAEAQNAAMVASLTERLRLLGQDLAAVSPVPLVPSAGHSGTLDLLKDSSHLAWACAISVVCHLLLWYLAPDILANYPLIGSTKKANSLKQRADRWTASAPLREHELDAAFDADLQRLQMLVDAGSKIHIPLSGDARIQNRVNRVSSQFPRAVPMLPPKLTS